MASTAVASSSITALLGPTNTGKTHRAVERMLEHDTGMIGLPLRLLAREIYDRISARLGEAPVALVTGEEKRIPPRARYFVCTVEAMPIERDVDFLAVDEIQLAAHRERGHVFTERLLRARGLLETWFLGAGTMRPIIEQLVPSARFVSHPRLSKLSGRGAQSLGSLPPRSAVVAFSMPRVYEIAERIRRRRGGAAVVLGALSPRARNAQVALFQSGEVEYMVATDAIGMGLNLALDHVVFADLRKFDGKESRPLEAHELAQIAGRAGRHLNDGSFATLHPLPALAERLSQSIELHRFPKVRQLIWRNPELDTASLDALLGSLERAPRSGYLKRVERADDLAALSSLVRRPEIRARTADRDRVALLWRVCQVPDYRQLLLDHHANLIGEIFVQLTDRGSIDPDWIASQIARADDTVGDIDMLMQRMESVRTWTYVTSHPDWVRDAAHWHARAREIEDRLSDALHQALVERFVDRSRVGRSRLPIRPANGHPFGKLSALRAAFDEASPTLSTEDAVEALVAAEHERFVVDATGSISADGRPLAILTAGSDLLRPEVRVTLEELGSGSRSRIQRRLVAWSRDLVSELFAELRADRLAGLSAAGRGLLYQLEQQLGTVLTAEARAQLDALAVGDRALLRAAGIELGRHVVFARSLLGAAALTARAALCSAHFGADPLPPRAGVVSFPASPRAAASHSLSLGYVLLGPRAVRADVVERVARSAAHVELGRIASWLGCPRSEASRVLAALELPGTAGGRSRRRRRARRRAPAQGV
jgi:ATP-dependent RNA helicase SUPV3L1/SUV3